MILRLDVYTFLLSSLRSDSTRRLTPFLHSAVIFDMPTLELGDASSSWFKSMDVARVLVVDIDCSSTMMVEALRVQESTLYQCGKSSLKIYDAFITSQGKVIGNADGSPC
ncbi:hypothetical protein V6N13_127495 [Hibiscus sabdariffa]